MAENSNGTALYAAAPAITVPRGRVRNHCPSNGPATVARSKRQALRTEKRGRPAEREDPTAAPCRLAHDAGIEWNAPDAAAWSTFPRDFVVQQRHVEEIVFGDDRRSIRQLSEQAPEESPFLELTAAVQFRVVGEDIPHGDCGYRDRCEDGDGGAHHAC